MTYSERISAVCRMDGRFDLAATPDEIEEWMRVGHPTLDHLDAHAFMVEVRIAAACFDEAGSIRRRRIGAPYHF